MPQKHNPQVKERKRFYQTEELRQRPKAREIIEQPTRKKNYKFVEEETEPAMETV